MKELSTINFYAKGNEEIISHFNNLINFGQEIRTISTSIDSNDTQKDFIISIENMALDLLFDTQKSINQYFIDFPPVELVEQMNNDIPIHEPEDPRNFVKKSKDLLNKLSQNVENLSQSTDYLKRLRIFFITLLGMAQKTTHESLIISFNEVKIEVERNFVTNGSTNPTASCLRCISALEAVFQSMNPANDLKSQLLQFPNDDPRVLALIPIIEYLDNNGPLYPGSSTQVDLQRFINQMQLAKAETLVELAFTIESHVPESLRHLTETCDPCKNIYTELDGDLDIIQLTNKVKESTESSNIIITSLRQNIRDYEKNIYKNYKILHTKLWRIMLMLDRKSVV